MPTQKPRITDPRFLIIPEIKKRMEGLWIVPVFPKKGLQNRIAHGIIPRVSTIRRTDIGMSPSGKAPDFDSGISSVQIRPSQPYDPLAQQAEQLPFKQWVRSSNLRRVTKNPECASVRDFYLLPPHYSLFTNLRIRDFCKVRKNSE